MSWMVMALLVVFQLASPDATRASGPSDRSMWGLDPSPAATASPRDLPAPSSLEQRPTMPTEVVRIQFGPDSEADTSADSMAQSTASSAGFALESLLPSAPTTAPGRQVFRLEEVLDTALKRGREARQAKLALNQALQSLRTITAGYHPRGTATADAQDATALSLQKKLSEGTSVSVSHQRGSGGSESRTYSVEHGIFLNNSFDVRLAGLAYALAREDYRTRIQDFKLTVINAFFDLVSAQERLKTLQSGVTRASDLVALARARFELGLTNKVDVLNSEVELANARNAVLAQRQTVDRTRDVLLDPIGLPLDTPLDAFDPLVSTPPDEPGREWYRSELAAERLRVESARTRMNESRYQSFPDVKLTGSVTEQMVPGQPDVQAKVSYNFPIGTAASDHTYRSLVAAHENARHELTNRELRISREQRDIRRTLLTKAQSVEIAKQTVMAASESYEASQVSFQRGLVTNIDLRTAQSNLTNARNSYISLLIEYRQACFQYRRLFGGDL